VARGGGAPSCSALAGWCRGAGWGEGRAGMDETVRVVGRLAPVTGLVVRLLLRRRGLFGGGFGAKGQPGRPGFVVDRAFRGGRSSSEAIWVPERGVGVEDGGLRRDRRRRAGMLRNLKRGLCAGGELQFSVQIKLAMLPKSSIKKRPGINRRQWRTRRYIERAPRRPSTSPS